MMTPAAMMPMTASQPQPPMSHLRVELFCGAGFCGS
jgi:hypothetical protein